MHAVILKTGKNPRAANPDPVITDANQKLPGRNGQWNPQDDLGVTPRKQLYICCHVRRVEMGLDDNDDSGGGKAANESQMTTMNQLGGNSMKVESKRNLAQDS